MTPANHSTTSRGIFLEADVVVISAVFTRTPPPRSSDGALRSRIYAKLVLEEPDGYRGDYWWGLGAGGRLGFEVSRSGTQLISTGMQSTSLHSMPPKISEFSQFLLSLRYAGFPVGALNDLNSLVGLRMRLVRVPIRGIRARQTMLICARLL